MVFLFEIIFVLLADGYLSLYFVMKIPGWAQEHLQKSLSVSTVHRVIHKWSFKLYHTKKKPYVNVIQKCHHLLRARAQLKWTEATWKPDLWSDELKCEYRENVHCVQDGRSTRILYETRMRQHPSPRCLETSLLSF